MMRKMFRRVAALGVAAGLMACDAGPMEEASTALEAPQAAECRHELLPPGIDPDQGGEVHQSLAPTSIVVPILLIPQGSTVTAQQLTTLRQGLGNVRRWYQRELPNKNVKWASLTTLYGDYTASYYLQNNNVWNVLPGEMQNKLGWNPWTYNGTNHRIALVIGRDLLGWAGGAGYSDGRGLAILGLESLADQAKCAGNWWCTQEIWHGTVVHELGHGFTLPHDSDPSSIMNFHGDYTNKHFVPGHAATVEANPATEAKQANWSYCSIDYQCATKRCGGNWSGDRLWCLPSSLYPKEAQNIPNGYTCRFPSQCASGRCELNADGVKVCSASTLPAYVVPFFPDMP